MNAKYFEENGFEDFHGTKFHKAVLDHAACIANNLMFDATHPDNNDGETAANAYHVMIALCEAGLSRIDEKCVAKKQLLPVLLRRIHERYGLYRFSRASVVAAL